MPDLSPLQHWRRIVIKCFPWLARIGVAPSGALQIKSAVGRIEIEGGGPAVLRVGDVRRLVFDPGEPLLGIAPALYYADADGGPFLPVAVVAPGSTVGGTVPPPPLVTPSTALAPSGSSKVACG